MLSRALVAILALLALVVLLPPAQAELSVDERVFAFEGPRVVVMFANGTVSGGDAGALREAYDADANGAVEPEEAELAEQDLRALAQEGGEGARFDAAPVREREVLEATFENLEGPVASGSPVLVRTATRLAADPAADGAPDAWAFEQGAPPQAGARWVFLAPAGYRVANVSGLVEPTRADGERSVQGQPSAGGNVTVTFARDVAGIGDAQEQEREQEAAAPEDEGGQDVPAPGVALLVATLAAVALGRPVRAAEPSCRRGR